MAQPRNTSETWHGRLQPRCNELGHDRGDPRHEGRVLAIHNSAWVTVRWEETGWKSTIPLTRWVRQVAEVVAFRKM